MKKAIYISTFNPIHISHVDALKAASMKNEDLTVIVYDKPGQVSEVEIDTRVEWVEKALEEANVKVKVIKLNIKELPEFIKENKVDSVVRRLLKTPDMNDRELMFKKRIHEINDEIDMHYVVVSNNITSSSIRRLIQAGKPATFTIKANGESKEISLVPETLREQIEEAYNV